MSDLITNFPFQHLALEWVGCIMAFQFARIERIVVGPGKLWFGFGLSFNRAFPINRSFCWSCCVKMIRLSSFRDWLCLVYDSRKAKPNGFTLWVPYSWHFKEISVLLSSLRWSVGYYLFPFVRDRVLPWLLWLRVSRNWIEVGLRWLIITTIKMKNSTRCNILMGEYLSLYFIG